MDSQAPALTSADAAPRRRPQVQAAEIDIGHVLLEARTRWLKPVEVCDILRNFRKYEFQLNQEPPVKPPGGSLFLFDRKIVRYFRRDGHVWRKKKDGKTVREAHEKLKAGSVDILHCYYAHAEQDDRFQRRCYWMLDGQNENIVLVHYREVAQGPNRRYAAREIDSLQPSAAEPLVALASTLRPSASPFSAPYLEPYSADAAKWRINSPLSDTTYDTEENSHDDDSRLLSGADKEEWEEEEEEEVNHEEGRKGDWTHESNAPSFAASAAYGGGIGSSGLVGGQLPGTFLDAQAAVQRALQQVLLAGQQRDTLPGLGFSDMVISKEQRDTVAGLGHEPSSGLGLLGDERMMSQLAIGSNRESQHVSTSAKVFIAPSQQANLPAQQVNLPAQQANLPAQQAELFNLIGQQVIGNQRIRSDTNCLPSSAAVSAAISSEQVAAGVEANVQNPLLASDMSLSRSAAMDMMPSSRSAALGSLGALSDGELFQKLDSFGRWMNEVIESEPGADFMNELGTTGDVEPVRRDNSSRTSFRILEYLPVKCSTAGGKIVVIGRVFNGSEECHQRSLDGWGCRFGSVEVVAEQLQPGVLRCVAPSHVAEHVPLTVTRFMQPCSDSVPFEFADEMQPKAESTSAGSVKSLDILLQAHLLRFILSEGSDLGTNDWAWVQEFSEALKTHSSAAEMAAVQQRVVEMLFQELLPRWLLQHQTEVGRLDARGMSIVHVAAGLGYSWALPALIAAGVDWGAKDSRGWTALDWAVANKKLEFVESLKTIMTQGLASGSLPQKESSLVTGKVSEAASVSRWNRTAAVSGENAMEDSGTSCQEGTYSGDNVHLEGKEVDHAVKRIQKAYRGHRDKKLTKAATKIQKRFRGYKHRKEFLHMRQKAVKIQAHWKGHMQRNRYKKMKWSLVVLSRAIGRWRKKRAGLTSISNLVGNNVEDQGNNDQDVWESVEQFLHQVPSGESWAASSSDMVND